MRDNTRFHHHRIELDDHSQRISIENLFLKKNILSMQTYFDIQTSYTSISSIFK